MVALNSLRVLRKKLTKRESIVSYWTVEDPEHRYIAYSADDKIVGTIKRGCGLRNFEVIWRNPNGRRKVDSASKKEEAVKKVEEGAAKTLYNWD